MGTMICELRGWVGFVEICSRVAKHLDERRLPFTWMLVVLLTSWLLVEAGSFARAQSPSVSADLAFLFDCKQAYPSALDEPIERFLTEEGFRVLNQNRVVTERGLRATIPVLIFGLNKERSIITFSALPPMQGKYSGRLITQPPTHRKSTLEEHLLKLVSDQLGCRIYQVNRAENGAASAEAFDRHFKMIERCFRDAGKI